MAAAPSASDNRGMLDVKSLSPKDLEGLDASAVAELAAAMLLQLAERDALIASMDVQLTSKDAALAAREREIRFKDASIERLTESPRF